MITRDSIVAVVQSSMGKDLPSDIGEELIRSVDLLIDIHGPKVALLRLQAFLVGLIKQDMFSGNDPTAFTELLNALRALNSELS